MAFFFIKTQYLCYFYLMELIINFYTYILEVFEKGVFGLKIYELGLTFLIILLSLSIRGLFAKFILSRIKKIISKTGN